MWRSGRLFARMHKVLALVPSMAFFVVVVCFVFQDRVSLYSLGCTRIYSVDQAGLKLRNLPASASQVLGLKVCATPLPISQYGS